MGAIGLVDGRIVNLEENVIPLEDRGHQFGDGVYEVTRVYNGVCFAFEMHMNRLYRSLRELRIPVTYTMDELRDMHQQLIQESGIIEGAIYLQITRGVAPRNHSFPDKIIPKLTMSIRPVVLQNYQELWESGAKVITTKDERWLRCDIKSLNLLGNVLAKQKAKEAKCFEGLLVRDQFITEGTSSNFFMIKDGLLWTYPTSNLILSGITRTIIIEKLVPLVGLMVVEKPFTPEFALTADESFLSGTMTEIMPITHIDGIVIKNGEVGDFTRKLQLAYRELISQHF